MPRSRRCRCSPCRWRSAVAWRSRSREGSVPARRGRSWRRRFVGVDAGLDIIQLRREFGLRQLPVAGFSLPLRFMDGGGPCAITPAGSTLGVPDDQIRRLRPRRPMPRWPRTGGRGLWSRTAVSGRRGGPPRHAAVVQPLPFPTTKSSSSKPVKRSGLWWTRGLPPVEDRDRRGTTWRTGRRACGCRPWLPLRDSLATTGPGVGPSYCPRAGHRPPPLVHLTFFG